MLGPLLIYARLLSFAFLSPLMVILQLHFLFLFCLLFLCSCGRIIDSLCHLDVGLYNMNLYQVV